MHECVHTAWPTVAILAVFLLFGVGVIWVGRR